MTDPSCTNDTEPEEVVCGTFLRRFQALLVDAVIYIGGTVAIFALGALLRELTEAAGYVLLVWLASYLLYEPVTVWLTGGTPGHHALNLRVVHNRTSRNLGFLRALLRFWVKAFLGLFSFVFMAVTRRHQALHDLATDSTVRIKDLAKAESHHFVSARVAEPTGPLPSRPRRVVVIIGYSAVTFVTVMTIASVYSSAECIDSDVCTPVEELVWNLAGLVWLAATAGVIVAGWRGRLPGARMKRQEVGPGAAELGHGADEC